MKYDTSDIIAVVMAGGRSKRMGHDKGLIEYRDKAHRYFMADVLKTIFSDVVISVPHDFEIPQNNSYRYVKDVIADLGPLGGLYSLFKAYPNKSFLIIATDMPEVESNHITHLLQHRDKLAVATCYENEDGFVEPLFAIWENNASSIVEKLVLENKLSMRMILKNYSSRVISMPDKKGLININTEDERKNYFRNRDNREKE